jgi:hypothetical protein
MVREGFSGSDESLPGRIDRARLLAFYYSADICAAVAGLKAPDRDFRRELFDRASVTADPAVFKLELGWVYVIPPHRRKRIAEGLCRQLLGSVSGCSVFATTRPDNVPMKRILGSLGFTRVGEPFPRRDEQMVVFLQS